MKPVILFESRGLINGTLLDCLDLFVYCSMIKVPVSFSLIDTNGRAKETLKTLYLLYKERGYNNYYPQSILDDITIIKKIDLFYIQSAIFFDYMSLKNTYSFLRNTKIVCVSNLLKDEDPILLNSLKDNVSFWGEQSYGFHINEEYVPKMLIPISKMGSLPLVVCPGVDDLRYAITSGVWGKFSLPEEYIFRGRSSYNSLWGRFNEVIYLQSPTVYDRKPRIMYEARKCNIPVSYIHCLGQKIDGSTHRYLDRKNRDYIESDRLVEWIRNEN